MGWVKMDYLEEYANGWRYRRRVPKRLDSVIVKNEFKKKLGKTKQEALAALPAYHAAVEREIREADRKAAQGHAADSGELTDREAFAVALQRVSELAADGLSAGAKDALIEHLIRKYAQDPETLDPVGATDVDRHMVNLIRNGPEVTVEPSPTVEDARKLYIAEKLGGEDSEANKKNIQRVNRVFAAMREALGITPDIVGLRRDDAKAVRDHLLSQVKSNGEVKKPSSVKRELTIIKATLNHAIKEMDLTGKTGNPFNDLEVPTTTGPQSDARQRDPLPPEVLKAVRERVIARANPDLARIWRVLEGTGCRLAEVTGLRIEDAITGGELPHIRVEWHEDRRVKTKASIRHVPLVGDALEAVKEAIRGAGNGTMLFPRYGSANGPGNASNALMNQYVRRVTKNRKHVVHSLRHNMADHLNAAEVPNVTKNLILGHALGGVGDRVYGGDAAKLRAATKALKAALEVDQ